MAALPAQIQQHEKNQFHIKLWRKKEGEEDTVVSFALGRKGLEKLMTCSDRTGGPKGIFDQSAWNCAGKEPGKCSVIAGGTYLKGTDVPGNFNKNENNPYEIDFTSGDGFDGGRLVFNIKKFGPAPDPRFEGQYWLTPLECKGMDVAKLVGETSIGTGEPATAKRRGKAIPPAGSSKTKAAPKQATLIPPEVSPAKARPKKQSREAKQAKAAAISAKPGCLTWDRIARWKYYENPEIAGKMWKYIDKRCDGAESCDIESELVSTTKKLYIGHKIIASTAALGGSPESRMSQLESKNHGIVDILVRLGAVPEIKMLDIDVNTPKDVARDVTKAISAYLARRKFNPEVYFTGKTGYHVEYHDGIEDLRQAEALVDEIVENVQPKFPDIVVAKGTQHPEGKPSVVIDWSKCSSAKFNARKERMEGSACIVPFSLRWDSCSASVPVDFKRLPKFDPDVHADPNYVVKHMEKFA